MRWIDIDILRNPKKSQEMLKADKSNEMVLNLSHQQKNLKVLLNTIIVHMFAIIYGIISYILRPHHL
jgi:hypothetical protein